MLYVNPDDFNASDLISNNGNSPTRPFKTIQRALIEVARFSYIQGQNNDKYDQFTINLAPGEYIIDNRPGKSNSAEVSELSDQSNFNIFDPANDLYKFNSVEGGLVIPRGTSLVGMDLRKTRVRPRYVPDPANDAFGRTSIFRVTGACYFWQFSLFDALPTSDVSGNGGVYKDPNSTAILDSNYSHHKVTCFTYADQTDLDLFYAKCSRAFASIPTTPGELESRTQETRIVGPLQQAGQIDIQSITVAGSLVTIVTDGPHEVFEGQQITIEEIIGTYSGLNGTYYVTNVANDTTLTITVNGFTPGSVPSGELNSAIVKAEIDTVDSSSPYIFNCSLRSTYGLCGLWADGSRVSGFKSMVVAQFTGVSLQKDDRAFTKFSETTTDLNGNIRPSFIVEGQSGAVALHQDSTRGVYYRGEETRTQNDWRHYHIRVSNNAFIQSVSVFAVGYAEQHLIESGGDYSITNSNSNFGTQALIADGFRPDAFTLDKKGHFTHIVPPQALTTLDSDIQYYPLDVQQSRDGVQPDSEGDKLYLFAQTDPAVSPIFDINNTKLGGRRGDKIYARLTNPQTSRFEELPATISPSGVEEHEIKDVSIADNLFTVDSTHQFETATPIRIYSSTGYLPLGMESNRLYYAIKISNTTFKIAPSAEDARAGAGGSANSIVNIRSDKSAAVGAQLIVKSFISDTNPELPRFNVTVNANLETFNTGTFPHGFTTGDKVFFRRRVIADQVSTGQLPQIQQSGVVQAISLTTEYFVYVEDAYNFKIANTESDANNNIPIPIDAPGDVAQVVVYRNIQKSPLRFDPRQGKGWYISVLADNTNKIHPVLTSSNVANIYSNPALTNTENVFFKRVSDNRALADRTYRMRYVIPKDERNARPPLVGYVVQRRTDASNVIEPYTNDNGSTQTQQLDRIYYIYRADTILKHIPDEQDGVYYLTILLADIAPKGAQFNLTTDTFSHLKYSQDVGKIYPDLDKDNPEGDPAAATSVADNLVHGLVYQDDDRNSITKEAVETFVADAGFSPALLAVSGKATSGQENRLIAFNSTNELINIELRRTSQIRAGNQTFEYTGFGSGNYSTAFPSKQEIVLTDKEVLYSQAQRRRAGVVFYSGLNAYGDLYVGNQKINAITGETEIIDKPILRVAGSAAVVNEEYVPYVGNTKNVNIAGFLTTTGGDTKLANSFQNKSKFDEGIIVATENATNRAIITQDIVFRPKQISVETQPTTGNAKQVYLGPNNLKPVVSNEGVFPGDIIYKSKINRNTRSQGYIYVGGDATDGGSPLGVIGDYRQIGLIGTGHLTSIEESYSAGGTPDTSVEPYKVTGKFGINQMTPTASLHVGDGDVLFDNDLKVMGDVTIEGGDLKTSASTFNYTDTSTTVNFATSATTMNVAASNATAAGRSGGTSVTNLKSDKLKVYSDIELVGQYDSTTSDSGPKTLEISTTADTTNFLTVPSTVNFSSANMNAFTGATNIKIGNNTGNTTINHDLIVSGNLTVNGTTTYVNSTIVDLDDPIISVGGSGNAAGAPSSAANKDRGIELKYYSGSAKSGFMGLNVGSMKYELYTDATGFSSNNITGTLATLRLNKLEATDDVDVDGDVIVDGKVHASTFELDATLSYTALGNEFNSTMRKAIEKHALPIGAIIMWGGGTIPDGYAECNGGTYQRRNGSTAASPDMRGRFIVGAGGNYSGQGGSKTKTTSTNSNATTLKIDASQINIGDTALSRKQIPRHTHGMNHGHFNINIDTFSAYGGNNNAINALTSTNGGSHTHNLTNMNHHHWFGGDDHLEEAAQESEMGQYWAGNVVATDNSGEWYDWESGSSGSGRYRVYKTSNPKTNGSDTDWGPGMDAAGASHDHTVTITSSKVVGAIKSGEGKVTTSNMLDNQGGQNTLTAKRTGDGSDGEGGNSGIGESASAAKTHTHSFALNNNSDSGLKNRSHTHTIDDISPPFHTTTMLIKL